MADVAKILASVCTNPFQIKITKSRQCIDGILNSTNEETVLSFHPLLPNTEMLKDVAEDFVGRDCSGDLTQIMDAFA